MASSSTRHRGWRRAPLNARAVCQAIFLMIACVWSTEGHALCRLLYVTGYIDRLMDARPLSARAIESPTP